MKYYLVIKVDFVFIFIVLKNDTRIINPHVSLRYNCLRLGITYTI